MGVEYENATKKRIREEALRLIKEKGFEAVSLTDICKASGINKHTFYYYFSSKDELLKQYYIMPFELSASELSEIFTNSSYVEQLWLLRRNMTQSIVDVDVTITKQLLIKNLEDNVGTFEISEERRRMHCLQESIIEKGQAAGEILSKMEPTLLLLLLNQTVHATIFMWSMRNGSFDLWKTIRYMYEKILEVSPEHCTAQDFSLKGIW
jgi:AcrR family transcriptional regulator